MKPKTKLEKQVVKLAKGMKPVTDKQMAWGLDKCLDKWAVVAKHQAYCLECGESWDHKGTLVRGALLGNVTPIDCPCCGKELQVIQSKARTYKQGSYFGVMTTCGGFQVYRFIMLKKTCKAGLPANCTSVEVMQHWIHASGKVFLIARPTASMSYCLDAWVLGCELELRSIDSWMAKEKLTLTPLETHPVRRFIPELKRNGFDGKFREDISPTRFFHRLLTDPEIETLLKAGQHSMLAYALKNNAWGVNTLHEKGVWNSVKICIRNRYIIKKATMWVDYLQLLQEFNKDLLNSHFVCPVDLKASHDLLVKKKRDMERRKRLEQLREEITIHQEAYVKAKGKFFGIAFTSGELLVKVIESVQEVMLEGDHLHHCVFTNGYYKRKNSLLLSARIGDTPVETVEISLETLDILQSRGLLNKPSPYHNQVIDLVKQNLPTIGQLVRQ